MKISSQFGVLLSAILMAVLSLWIGPGLSAADDDSLLMQLLQSRNASDLYPGADKLQILADQDRIARASARDELLGYVFVNTDFVDSTGYSGRPIHVLVALDSAGVIRNAELIKHYEPIVLAGIPESSITAFVARLIGLDLPEIYGSEAGSRVVDAVSGATVTARVIDDSVVRSSYRVARLLGITVPGGATVDSGMPARELDPSLTEVRDWIGLIADQSVTRLRLEVGDVSRVFAEGALQQAAARPESDDPADLFIELYAAPVSVPSIGLSLLGEAEYANLQKRLQPGQQAILLMGRGLYSYKGSGYVRGGIFDRFEVTQGDEVFRFIDFQNKRLRAVAADGAPDFREVDLFYLPADGAFDLARPWQVQLLVGRAIGPTQKSFVAFQLEHQLPERYFLPAEPGPESTVQPPQAFETRALWQDLWLEKIPEIAALCLLLGVLTFVFYFQNWVVQHTRMFYWGRMAFLACTLFGLGFYANAQLSVVNIITVANAIVSGFKWTYFLMEPLIFILWGGVAIALLFWGRGVYCGWLCPFGALQELMNKASQALGIRQIVVPWGLHERLWTLKYILFVLLFGVSLHSLVLAEYLAEVEPFKTTIILKFAREWPFVLYAVAVLLPGLFIERFYCRYLCALGAALAIPARMRMFDWLKRYHDCGQPCQICASNCMVGAIHPEGNINPNECHSCLHCQELYYDEQVCPVMVAERKKRERRARWAGGNRGTTTDPPIIEVNTASPT